MEVKITKPEIGVVAVIGASLWENEDGVHIKPKGTKTVKASYIDGLLWESEDGEHIQPTDSKLINATHIDGLPVITKAISFSIGGSLDDTISAFVEVPFTMTIDSVSAACSGNVSGSDLILDINKNGTTLYTTQANRPTIATGTSSVSATDPDVTSLTAGDILSVDIDQVGTASNLMVTIICTL